MVLGINPRALYIVDKHSPTARPLTPIPQPYAGIFFFLNQTWSTKLLSGDLLFYELFLSWAGLWKPRFP